MGVDACECEPSVRWIEGDRAFLVDIFAQQRKRGIVEVTAVIGRGFRVRVRALTAIIEWRTDDSGVWYSTRKYDAGWESTLLGGILQRVASS